MWLHTAAGSDSIRVVRHHPFRLLATTTLFLNPVDNNVSFISNRIASHRISSRHQHRIASTIGNRSLRYPHSTQNKSSKGQQSASTSLRIRRPSTPPTHCQHVRFDPCAYGFGWSSALLDGFMDTDSRSMAGQSRGHLAHAVAITLHCRHGRDDGLSHSQSCSRKAGVFFWHRP